MSDWPKFIDPDDLAPGDSSPHPNLSEGIRLHVVESPGDPLFDLAFRLLDDEFAKAGEMETREVLEKRLLWHPARPMNGCRLLYRIMLLFAGDECVGLRDHTAILRDDFSDVVVHLSHVLVLPKWRRKGLATLLRTLPMTTAKECARLSGRPGAPVTLFCEMEPLDLSIPANRIRRLSYGKAGFMAVGSHLGYSQPDFRAPPLIDADPLGTRPVPFDFLLRRAGRESETVVPAFETVGCVELIYAMYGVGFRPQDMRPCLNWLADFKARPDLFYPLFPPIEAP
ncbi:MAG: hypothetical protein WC360_06860 [Opitutales bacterium]|jgi:GNAT superfamily N-acetyltransferase